MSYNNGLAGLVILALLLITIPTPVTSAISCTQALTDLMPCQLFLMGIGDVSAPCCQGAQTLLSQVAGSFADRKSICQCLKQAATSININPNKAMQLPQLCKINLPSNIQPNVDCDTIAFDEASSRMNRYKNMEFETKDFRPTPSGHSPGIGHPPELGSKWTETKDFRPTPPGHSPGIGHPPELGSKWTETKDFRPTPPGHSPGIGHPPELGSKWTETKDFRPTPPGHSPGIGHPPELGSKWTETKDFRPTPPGHSPGIGHPPELGSKFAETKDFRPTTPGHSPGIGHPPELGSKIEEVKTFRPTTPGHSPGIGHPPELGSKL